MRYPSPPSPPPLRLSIIPQISTLTADTLHFSFTSYPKIYHKTKRGHVETSRQKLLYLWLSMQLSCSKYSSWSRCRRAGFPLRNYCCCWTNTGSGWIVLKAPNLFDHCTFLFLKCYQSRKKNLNQHSVSISIQSVLMQIISIWCHCHTWKKGHQNKISFDYECVL